MYYIHLAGALLNRQLLDGSKDGTVRDTLTYLHEEGALLDMRAVHECLRKAVGLPPNRSIGTTTSLPCGQST